MGEEVSHLFPEIWGKSTFFGSYGFQDPIKKEMEWGVRVEGSNPRFEQLQNRQLLCFSHEFHTTDSTSFSFLGKTSVCTMQTLVKSVLV